MAKAPTNISIDADIKARAQELFADLGLDLSTAVNIFLRQAIRENAMPFSIRRNEPNAETIDAMKEMDDMLSGKISAKKYSDTESLFADLEA